ncbi:MULTISPECIES: HugZ family protein [Thiomicrorhabdus]|uniref:Pyridoxamine 5'-phosphate oxidase family protein n=1 Tax=Thiomicrorhabdus heinhorstiae TaxID=2748010 RepID=A0ABS0BY93_9GAMM|nr:MULTISPECIES: pyridoxamine 5'-phosphate oxidase family protein [Thiomicrorhabdus]MBF6058768.1 pyridoxamine 5'-phosphate oxidase family protein [Thiomicrorhabdus heinhorstiae]
MSNQPTLAGIHKEFQEFTLSHNSVILGTVDPHQRPEASYAPVLKDIDRFYIYVSELSKHTLNLLEHPRASLLFIENEENAKHLFARKRATLETRALRVPRDSEIWHKIIEKMEDKFGEIIQMLRPLEDFHLFELTPQSAGYVRGFAQAYRLEGENLSEVTHIRDRGHGKSREKTA